MSVYNGERWLTEAMDSVLAQSFTDFEFLIHDDGSRDGSLALLRDYAARDSRIVVSTGPNKGLAAVLNALIEAARGMYLARMDADDISFPDRFERQIAHLDAHPEIAVLGGFVRYMDEDGRPVIDMEWPTGHEEIDARNVTGANAIAHPTVMMRREPVRAVGGYDESFATAQDLDLWLRMAERYRLGNLPAIVLDYRFHPSGLSGTRQRQADSILRARQLAAQRRGLPDPEPRKPWHPAPDRRSQRDFAMTWAKQAESCGYRDTARHYYLKALKLGPLSPTIWRVSGTGLMRLIRNGG